MKKDEPVGKRLRKDEPAIQRQQSSRGGNHKTVQRQPSTSGSVHINSSAAVANQDAAHCYL